jgi:hypothetical protein
MLSSIPVQGQQQGGEMGLKDDSIGVARDSVLGDGQRVLHINYNRNGNCFLIRPLNDELERIDPA